MTSVILNKLESQNESKRDKKLWISRNNKRSRFQDGTMKLSKNFMKNNINNSSGNASNQSGRGSSGNSNSNQNKFKSRSNSKNKFFKR